LSDYKIAIIDDDKMFSVTLKEILEEYHVDTYSSSTEGIKAIKNNSFDILILDYFIDNLNGDDIVKKIRTFNKNLYIIILTGFSKDIPPLKALEEMSIQDYCVKRPQNYDDIIIRIKSAIKSIDHIKENKNGIYFSKNLKILRESKNELQTDLAKILGVSRQTIGSYELGRNEPNFKILKKIAQHYNVSIDYLINNN
jgi:DNA-binding response OmpR family regulator